MITADSIHAAAQRIKGAVERTACLHSRTLSDMTGASVWLKFENRQFTASFKERGALNRLSELTEKERNKGVICMSAGNHAQGVAYHAQRLGIPATIVMPANTPFVKVEQARFFGPRILLEGDTLRDATLVAQSLCDTEELTLIHPYDDIAVIAGQGTVALEMIADVPGLEALLVPVGGGGLIAGMSVAAKSMKPEIEIVGVETEQFPSMADALRDVTRDYGGATLAEGIAVAHPGTLTLPIVESLVSEILLVSDARVESAILHFLEIEKTSVEGAGAVGLAALFTYPDRFRGQEVGIVITGGNIDSRVLSSIILRGLAREGRLMRILVEISDSPGNLAQVSNVVGAEGANIVDVYHERYFSQLPIRSAALILVLETRNSAHGAEILAALENQGFSCRSLPYDG